MGRRLLFAFASRLVGLALSLLVVGRRLPLGCPALLRNGRQRLVGFRVGLASGTGHQFLLRAGPLVT